MILQRKITHPVLGEILYQKRLKSKVIRVLICEYRGIRVTLPFFCSFKTAVKFVDDNLARIEANLKKIRMKREIRREPVNNLSPEALEELSRRAHYTLTKKLAELSGIMNENIEIRDDSGKRVEEPFSYNKVAIKNNKSNWGSCSVKRNINLNMHLMSLPEELQDFVIMHELCHLVYPNHSKEFHALLNKACNGREKELQKRLSEYHLV